jgi:hypothetical protein
MKRKSASPGCGALVTTCGFRSCLPSFRLVNVVGGRYPKSWGAVSDEK